MLKAQYKLALGLLPFLISGIFVSTSLYPNYLEDREKRGEVAAKKLENDTLLSRLGQKGKAESERKGLENQISALRGSVPKSPELDLFMLDLEKMCADSGVDLIAVEPPDAEALKTLDSSEEEVQRLVNESSGQGKLLGSKSLEKKPAVLTNNKTTADQEDKTALKKLVKQVYVTGDYDGVVKLMRRLEHYERVTGVKQVCVAMGGEKNDGPTVPAAERGQRMGLNQPVMSFLMTLYYLP
jgi:hypothetical protein